MPAMRENSMDELPGMGGPQNNASYGSGANLGAQLNGAGSHAPDVQSQASMRPLYDDNGRPLRVQRT